MATLVTTIPSVVFPYELDYIVVSASADVAVKITYGTKTLLDSILTPYQGEIVISNMSPHIIDYLYSDMQTLSIYLDGALAADTQILPNSMGVSAVASECYHDIFLSRATCKYTHATAKELLHFVPNGETYGTVKAVAEKDGAVIVSEQQLAISATGDIITLDVSPSVLFTLVDYVLVEYVVSIGSRTMKYRMIPDGMADKLHEFIFVNSFLQQECITLMGEAERDMKIERLRAYMGGRYRNFRVESIPHWTIHTHVYEGMKGMFDDFVAAKDVWRKDDGCVLTISDSEATTTSLSSAMDMCSVTLSEAGHIYTYHPVRTIHTFDSTFDDTFQ